MKLRNKKTGEIVKFETTIYADTEDRTYEFNSIAELNEDWEDYEEPKETWYIDCDGEVYEPTRLNQFDLDRMSNIGNLFETKEEAEKAVEKLKAWKRLKDKGFRVNAWYGGSKDISFSIPQEIIDKPTAKDLDLLFGGKE